MYVKYPTWWLKHRARPMRPHPHLTFFKEAIPLCGKNAVEVRRQRVPPDSCTSEMQALFGCLKKWEYDDLPCAKLHESYMRCVQESEKKVAKYREAIRKGTLGDDSSSNLTATQLNKIMKLFPQPDLGMYPYRVMKRLPFHSYADDLFRRKNTPGKRS